MRRTRLGGLVGGLAATATALLVIAGPAGATTANPDPSSSSSPTPDTAAAETTNPPSATPTPAKPTPAATSAPTEPASPTGTPPTKPTPTASDQNATPAPTTGPAKETPNVSPMIIGGTTAQIGDYPWMLSVRTPADGFDLACGGVLVGTDKVLTAAHCVAGLNTAATTVTGGRSNLSGTGGTVRSVTGVWSHPDYAITDDGAYRNDIAVLTLNGTMPYTTATLARPGDGTPYAAGTNARILGWGWTTLDDPAYSDALMTAQLPLVADSTCTTNEASFTTGKMLCAGPAAGGVDACFGDAGGPLLINGRVAGIISWGRGCADAGQYGVYTKIDAFTDMLDHVIPGPCSSVTAPGSTTAYQVCGAIRDKWWLLGGTTFGYPASNELTTADGVGKYTEFVRPDQPGWAGSIYWSPNNGAWSVQNGIRTRWLATGGPTGPLGYPVTDETPSPDGIGAFNHFNKATVGTHDGSIYWSPATGSQDIRGAIRAKWFESGAERGPLGYPTTGETGTPDGIGRFNHFAGDNGSIYWTADTLAHSIQGPVREAWAQTGWELGPLGYPVTDQATTADGGKNNRFSKNAYGMPTGGLYWHPTVGARQLYGEIEAKYAQIGGPARIGYPTTGLETTPNGLGKYTHFALLGESFNRASIYWSADTDAHLILGAIRTTWANMGWETSWLGFPTSDTFATLTGTQANFQSGFVSTHNGNGIATAHSYTLNNVAVAAGDFTGDGKTDAVTIGADGYLWLQPGTATSGTLAPPVQMWPDNTWNGITDITAGDFNGDGKTDLVAIWTSGLLRLYTGNGNGTLNSSMPLWGDTTEPDLYKHAKEIFAGDFNGDGKADLGVLWASGSLWLAPGNGSGRIDNGLAAIQMWPDNTFLDARQVFAGDFTHDGKTDMGVIWSSGSFWVQPGDGLGHITNGLQMWPDNSWSWMRDVVGGDFAGDGKADVVTIYDDGTLHVYPDRMPI